MLTSTVVLLALCQQQPAAAAPPIWTSTRLAGGVRVHVLQVADASHTAAFSFLPIGLGDDPVGRAQFSHLAEHMLIRSTDPQRLRVGELTFNGETTNQVLRLESLAPADQWRQAVARHPGWLTARSFDAEVLAREKIRIEGEERATVPRGFNHKWAAAAWGQVTAGRDHAAVHGDVAAATLTGLTDYIRARVDLAQARIFVAGPQAPKAVIEVLRAGFADCPRPPAVVGATPVAAAPAARAGAHVAATWDLAARHYLEWYALPADCPPAAAEVLAQVVSVACMQSRQLRGVPGAGMASVVRRQGRRYLLLSAHLQAGADHRKVQAGFQQALRRAPAVARIQVRGALFAAQFAKRPDFASLRRQVANPKFRRLVEANWAMQFGYACTRLGVEPAGVAAGYRAVDAKLVTSLLATHVALSRRESMVLRPRD